MKPTTMDALSGRNVESPATVRGAAEAVVCGMAVKLV